MQPQHARHANLGSVRSGAHTVEAGAAQRCILGHLQLQSILLLAKAPELGRFSRVELDCHLDSL